LSPGVGMDRFVCAPPTVACSEHSPTTCTPSHPIRPVVPSAALPHLRLRTDRVSSDVAADARGDVAFTSTRGNTAYGSVRTETVYLLRRGARAVQPVHRKRVAFAVCERQATVSWRGRWLLYTASEGPAVAVNTSMRRAVDFSSTIASLPGDGAQDVTASWIE